MSSRQDIDYRKVLDDFRARLFRLDEERQELLHATTAVERILRNLAVGTSAHPINGSGRFEKMTVFDAAKAYLRSVGGAATTRDLADALERGGITHKSKDFYNSVFATLTQYSQRRPELAKKKGKWILVQPKDDSGKGIKVTTEPI